MWYLLAYPVRYILGGGVAWQYVVHASVVQLSYYYLFDFCKVNYHAVFV
jgi:hypothetical protein